MRSDAELVEDIVTACEGKKSPVVVIDGVGPGSAIAAAIRKHGIRVVQGSHAVAVDYSPVYESSMEVSEL